MECGKKYTINQRTSIIIYGAATTGALIYSTFIKEECNVIAFIDKRADEIESYYDLPVLNLEQAGELFKENKEIIVIIGIKNVFEHEKIAKELWYLGCNKIIFRPYNVVKGKGEEWDKALNKAYSNILQGEIPEEGYEIEGFEEQFFLDKAVIESDDQYVVANIPIYYVFTDRKGKNSLWEDISCFGLVPHIGLFKFFLGIDNEDYLEYIKFCREAALKSGGIKVSKAWEESVYKNRLDVFNHMQYEWEHDRSFFIKNAVEADYNEKGYFNTKSGKHRIIFMLVNGKRYVPLKVTKADYEKWSSAQRAKEIKLILSRMKRESLPVILGNPYFYDFPCSASSFYEHVLIQLISAIYQEQYYKGRKFDFGKQNVLFYNTPLALYAAVLRMIGFEVDVVEDNAENKLIYGAIVDLDIKDALEDEKEYFLAVVEGKEELNKIKVNVQNKVYITDSRDEEGRLLATGLEENKFMYAFLKMGI